MQPAAKKADRTCIESLYYYIEHDYTKLLNDLLTEYEFSRSEKVAALNNALTQKKLNCLAVLLGHNVNVNGGNTTYQTPLLEAVLSRQISAVEWLLIYGADPNRPSPLTNFNDIPSVLECEASDSDMAFITPRTLARARLESRNNTAADQRIYNMLCRPIESWQDEKLKDKVIVSTNSCLEAIRHSDDYALLHFLDQCKYTRQLRQNYLNARLKLAVHMENISAMRILIRQGAQAKGAFQECVQQLESSKIKTLIVEQFVDDRDIAESKRKLEDMEHNPQISSSIEHFLKKKQRTLDILKDTRTPLLQVMSKSSNIAQSLQRRQTTGII